MNNTEKRLEEFDRFVNNFTDEQPRLEKHTKEVIIEQIDICLSGQDPRYQLGRYIEHLKEEIIHQAIAEERERTMQYLWKQIQDDYMGCIIEYFLKDQAKIMKIDLITNLDKEDLISK